MSDTVRKHIDRPTKTGPDVIGFEQKLSLKKNIACTLIELFSQLSFMNNEMYE